MQGMGADVTAAAGSAAKGFDKFDRRVQGAVRNFNPRAEAAAAAKAAHHAAKAAGHVRVGPISPGSLKTRFKVDKAKIDRALRKFDRFGRIAKRNDARAFMRVAK